MCVVPKLHCRGRIARLSDKTASCSGGRRSKRSDYLFNESGRTTGGRNFFASNSRKNQRDPAHRLPQASDKTQEQRPQCPDAEELAARRDGISLPVPDPVTTCPVTYRARVQWNDGGVTTGSPGHRVTGPRAGSAGPIPLSAVPIGQSGVFQLLGATHDHTAVPSSLLAHNAKVLLGTPERRL
jgi:hypothetical protein